MLNIGVLISGGGTNLQAIIDETSLLFQIKKMPMV